MNGWFCLWIQTGNGVDLLKRTSKKTAPSHLHELNATALNFPINQTHNLQNKILSLQIFPPRLFSMALPPTPHRRPQKTRKAKAARAAWAATHTTR
ncbi:hypothetical protein [Rhodanobacter sp. DHB23]|uniref:hypothetical protein n=1 Tax=Rhodanobacter sp. DHB23 TaxID=2775923 RepID=UPI00177D5CC1|nr:hypothetical protein [Rhodanobacter sp. DHB23]MBD8871835.1 hypothetical protein [Rhodanobacter sp. DHB23]